MKQLACLACAVALLGCGDDGGGPVPIDAPTDTEIVDTGTVVDAPTVDALDAPLPIDGPAPMVQVVPCAGAPVAATVTAPGFAFTFAPDNTINVGQVVRFEMPSFHSAVSGPPGQPDGLFDVGFNQTVCIRFNSAATIPFYCNPHQFTGSIVVQ